MISLHEQRAYFYKDNHLVGMSVLSTGYDEHPTVTGHFSVIQKDRDHRSSQYGEYVDSEGNVVQPEDPIVIPAPGPAPAPGSFRALMRQSDERRVR